MIVIGADTHKQSHTVGAIDAPTGRLIAERTVKARRRSFDDLLVWTRGLDAERVWTLEDAATSPARWSASCSSVASRW